MWPSNTPKTNNKDNEELLSIGTIVLAFSLLTLLVLDDNNKQRIALPTNPHNTDIHKETLHDSVAPWDTIAYDGSIPHFPLGGHAIKEHIP